MIRSPLYNRQLITTKLASSSSKLIISSSSSSSSLLSLVESKCSFYGKAANMVSFANSSNSSNNNNNKKKSSSSPQKQQQQPQQDPLKMPRDTSTRTYLTGFEHDPTFGPDAKRKEMLQKGMKLPPQGGRRAAYAQDDFEKMQNQTVASSTKRQDSRFTRKMNDFREMEDNDPYRNLFGEKRSFVRTKVGAWRNQFEKENENVELPYERSGFLTRSAPNWFVKWMIGLRENQGLDFIYLFGAFGTVIVIVSLWTSATVPQFGREKDATQLK